MPYLKEKFGLSKKKNSQVLYYCNNYEITIFKNKYLD